MPARDESKRSGPVQVKNLHRDESVVCRGRKDDCKLLSAKNAFCAVYFCKMHAGSSGSSAGPPTPIPGLRCSSVDASRFTPLAVLGVYWKFRAAMGAIFGTAHADRSVQRQLQCPASSARSHRYPDMFPCTRARPTRSQSTAVSAEGAGPGDARPTFPGPIPPRGLDRNREEQSLALAASALH